MHRSFVVGAAVVAIGVTAWVLSDRPALQIDVEPGGHAFVRGMWSDTALPETVLVRAVGSHTVIRIANRDSVRHHLGIFDIDAGETRDFVIAYPGVFGGFCSTHPASKQLVYVVE